jgi:hypothetical protein
MKRQNHSKVGKIFKSVKTRSIFFLYAYQKLLYSYIIAEILRSAYHELSYIFIYFTHSLPIKNYQIDH